MRGVGEVIDQGIPIRGPLNVDKIIRPDQPTTNATYVVYRIKHFEKEEPLNQPHVDPADGGGNDPEKPAGERKKKSSRERSLH